MKAIDKISGEQEDSFVLSLVRSGARVGEGIAAEHAQRLRSQAMKALMEKDADLAVHLAERAYLFNSRAYGISHDSARDSMVHLKLIQDIIRKESARAAAAA